MSIEKMKLFSVVGPQTMLKKATELLLSAGIVHFEQSSRAMDKLSSGQTSMTQVNPYDKPLERIEYFLGATQMTTETCEADEITDLDKLLAEYGKVADELTKTQNQIDAVHKEIVNDEGILDQLDHLKDTNVNLDALFNLKFYKFRFGRMTRDKYERLLKYNNADFVYFATAVSKEYAWLMYLTPAAFEDTVDLLFSKLDFERVRISDEAHGTPKEAYAQIQQRLEAGKREQIALEQRKQTQIDGARDFISKTYSSLKFARDAYEIRKYASAMAKSFSLSGWVPASAVDALGAQIGELEGVAFTVEDNKDADTPCPTKLKNNWFCRPFEQFVRMYGMPAYNEIDPTFFVALSYTVLFGAMFGDVGQGILLVILGIVYSRFSKNSSFGRIISTLGASSTVFGFVYGSVFGFEEIIPGLIRPMRDINTILGASIGVGMFMITVAMILNIINGFKQKSYIKILFGSNGLAGLVLYWAVTVWAIYYLIMNKNIMTSGYALGLMLVPFLLIFFSEPLSNLLSRKRGHDQSVVEFILQNLFEGFETILSYLTNTVSFIRVGAFVLSHAGMMLAVMELSKTASGGTNWLVVVLGNLFVVGFEGFIVGIQVLRLEFFEMFSRFYAGSGKEYTPVFTTVTKSKS